MTTLKYATEIVKEVDRTIGQITEEDSERLVDRILEARKVFVAGAGRSGFMAKSFVMRLMHMGLDAYVVGETVTPSLQEDDILIIASGSGETKSLVSMAEKAKSIDATVAVVTISPESTIGRLSDVAIKIPAKPKAGADSDYKTIQPMGSLFEQTLLLYFDATILRIMSKKGLESGVMYGRHANLE
ncbi:MULTISPECIES: 6-phospho-3-hexuloisomerase [Neobacillus]|uniref:6-phospho-3-hexuloisomerase n=1 Tax=Neobacillus rhizophilus TaxID=2833579 RepID=A0A942YYI2_9BACI|nr:MULTISPECIES: 6-phospho-3-hexuloisomerase [Neobacillus]MBS4216165.1 6-phospho-3-hexuloisomerase [Neobacillus rhizophilus]MBU8917274.1 6-phospho-3-hexuloisomerase [Bacillus sp. FJAT-29953]